jgi:hypothetical protein
VFAVASLSDSVVAQRRAMSDPAGRLDAAWADGEGQFDDRPDKGHRVDRDSRVAALVARRSAGTRIARERVSTRPSPAKSLHRAGIEIGHFRGQRSWSDKQLITAVPVCSDWSELLVALGYPADSGSARNTNLGHCARIGISHSHLDGHATEDQPPTREVR